MENKGVQTYCSIFKLPFYLYFIVNRLFLMEKHEVIKRKYLLLT